MSKFNTVSAKTAVRSPIATEIMPSGTTYEGAPGYARDHRSELFLLAVSNMVGENTFYESVTDRDMRFSSLIHELAVSDPVWTGEFLRWLRAEGNMRSASLVGAAEFVKARIDAKADGCNRRVVDWVCQRADEPGEFLAYWTSHFGRPVPMPVKRGLSDAVWRLYDERAALKYDTTGKGWRFGDVIDMIHPTESLRDCAGSKPVKGTWRGDLYEHLLNVRHGNDEVIPESLGVVRARAELMALPVGARRAVLTDPDRLRAAGMTWESLAGWLQGPLDAAAWTAIIPSMGYMAQLRNLKNFDEAGVSNEVAARVAARLSDPDQVARSRQFPFRFLSAYEQAPSLRWGLALDQALQFSLRNLLTLPGRSLILVDTSASMTRVGLSARSTMTPVKAAAVFGVALAARGDQVELVGFADGVFSHYISKGSSMIREIDRFVRRVGEVGHGTDIMGSLSRTYNGHDRVFIISDMQTMNRHPQSVNSVVPANIPIYGFNLSGYQRGAYATGVANRHEFGGLTDATFRMIPLLEAGRNGAWPWMFHD